MAIEFTNKPTKWENDGAEPSTELKKNGFQAGYKPPAGIFNHHWSESAKCIEELQTMLSGVDDKKAEVSDVLVKSNTMEFTPTDDFQPSTKKYVDDKVDSITVPIIDNLESDSTTSALSAKQGKVLDAAIAAKVDKVSGKGLSANDFTSEYKSKLDNLDTNLSAKAAKTEVLTKTNTTAFTPTANYQPATKKYVDDSIKTKVINGSDLSSLTLTVSSTIPTTLAAGTICFIPEA